MIFITFNTDLYIAPCFHVAQNTVTGYMLIFSAKLVEEDLGCHFYALSKARTDTWAEPPTILKLANKLPHMKESKFPGGIRTNSGEKQVGWRYFYEYYPEGDILSENLVTMKYYNYGGSAW